MPSDTKAASIAVFVFDFSLWKLFIKKNSFARFDKKGISIIKKGAVRIGKIQTERKMRISTARDLGNIGMKKYAFPHFSDIKSEREIILCFTMALSNDCVEVFLVCVTYELILYELCSINTHHYCARNIIFQRESQYL